MTLEEAVEIVLGADPWRACPRCIGTGQFIGADGSFVCARCDGWGTILRDDYVIACALLDKPFPRRGKPPVKARKVIFPTFEIQDQTIDKYNVPLSKMLDDAKLQAIAEIDREIIADEVMDRDIIAYIEAAQTPDDT